MSHPALAARRITGINQDLFCWALHSPLYNMAIGDADANQTKLANALGPDQSTRYLDSVNLMKAIWFAHPELGLAPDYKLLAEYEYNRSFYAAYRDHVTHMFKVFLLGLYLYENDTDIQTAISTFWRAEDFLAIWILTALWHDVGYLIETEDGTRDGTHTIRTIKRLNEVLSFPLAHLFNNPNSPGNSIFDVDTERRYQSAHGCDRLKKPADIKTIVVLEHKMLLLKSCGNDVSLTNRSNSNPIKHYYHYTASKKVGRSYYDHGIISACILLYFRDELCKYIKITSEMYENQKAEIQRFLDSRAKYQEYAQIAAEAIALHNIRKPSSDYGVTELEEYDITIRNLRIRLVNSPIAYLLRLCDEMQCWDRVRFDPPKDYTIDGDHLNLRINLISGRNNVTQVIDDESIRQRVKESVRGLFDPNAESFIGS